MSVASRALLSAGISETEFLPTLTLHAVSIYGVITYGHNTTGTRVEARQHRAVDSGVAGRAAKTRLRDRTVNRRAIRRRHQLSRCFAVPHVIPARGQRV